jgi:hypothetical protein
MDSADGQLSQNNACNKKVQKSAGQRKCLAAAASNSNMEKVDLPYVSVGTLSEALKNFVLAKAAKRMNPSKYNTTASHEQLHIHVFIDLFAHDTGR